MKPESYELVYSAPLSSADVRDQAAILDSLYARFNLDRPEDFHGHSLSVSDVIALKQNGRVTCYYTDSFGFEKLPDFNPPENALRNAEMAMEDDLNMLEVPDAPDHPHKPRHRNEPER